MTFAAASPQPPNQLRAQYIRAAEGDVAILGVAPGPARRRRRGPFRTCQTVRYRMTQLRELYGELLNDPRTILELTVALGRVPNEGVISLCRNRSR